jgi:hypothetical protein
MLDTDVSLPLGHSAEWMSQILCCFPEGEIINILTLVLDALEKDGVS